MEAGPEGRQIQVEDPDATFGYESAEAQGWAGAGGSFSLIATWNAE